MKAVIQRVNYCKVIVDRNVVSSIKKGLLVLAGWEQYDTDDDLEWMAKKIVGMRIFPDTEGKMNCSLKQTEGEILVVSQFTLHASTQKGNRPSFIKAARPDKAIPHYISFTQKLEKIIGKRVATGKFGEHMVLDLENDGPVTIVIDSKNKE